MQVVQWYLKRILRGGKSPLKVKAWIAAGFLLLPATLFCSPRKLASVRPPRCQSFKLASWATAACLLNMMSGSLYAVAHRDRIYLSLLSPLFDFLSGQKATVFE
jgi:hypothetical protein